MNFQGCMEMTGNEQPGQEILDEFLLPRSPPGGRLAILYGPYGVGKSTFMNGIEASALKENEIVIHRAKQTDNWHVVSKKIHVWVPQLTTYLFQKQMTDNSHAGELINFDYEELDIQQYRGPLDLARKITEGYNVVLEGDLEPVWSQMFWLLFVYAWNTLRKSYNFSLISIDEIADLFDSEPSDEESHIVKSFLRYMRDFRKNNINFIASSHYYGDIFYKIRQKVDFYIYLQGAMVDRKYSIIHKESMPRTLVQHEGLIESKTRFGHFFYKEGGLKPGFLIRSTVISEPKSVFPPWDDGSLTTVEKFLPPQDLYHLGIWDKKRKDEDI